ncbi:hypothetical protein BJ508DRAFT_324031 [Ascobolus immersus RN42]|uniref:Sin3 binding protein n=1 Tax=Ascobolus immersus RN42 TaxID=1160509 RepID=A0A3N4ID45_ASCIM|nr:hypothetical protein BJ508DRAFT_324031 [Ascobolus immersus RN42]
MAAISIPPSRGSLAPRPSSLPTTYLGMIPPTNTTLAPSPLGSFANSSLTNSSPSQNGHHFDATSITPSLLAKHHIPRILLTHGPLAIRHLTAHLITALPPFSTIPPGKQRRLVVAALEGRSGGTGGRGVGGVNGDVVFEKIGWGRWSAHMMGEEGHLAKQKSRGHEGVFQMGEDMDEDTEMEESGSASTSDGEATDEEDWEAMGCEMLRTGASPSQGDGFLGAGSWRGVGSFGGTVATSYGTSPSPWMTWGQAKGRPESPDEEREREAIEALVKLGRA